MALAAFDQAACDPGHLSLPGFAARQAEQSPLAGHKKYRYVKDLDSGQFGKVQLAVDLSSGEQVAIKFIPRGIGGGPGANTYIKREIANHRRLSHPHIIGLREVFLTHEYIGIALEYAAGGNLWQLVSSSGGLTEPEARWWFQQVVHAVDYCHKLAIVNRDLKLENLLLSNKSHPLLKLCDFGFSKDEAAHSAAASQVGTPAYLAPEVIQAQGTYDGKMADVWSLGVILYALVAGRYPFGSPGDAQGDCRAMRRMLLRVIDADYTFPEHVEFSPGLRDLIARILVADPDHRASLAEIQQHTWYVTDLPEGLAEANDELLREQLGWGWDQHRC